MSAPFSSSSPSRAAALAHVKKMMRALDDDSRQQIAERHARTQAYDRNRKRNARARMTPAEREQTHRHDRVAQKKRRAAKPPRPFIGIDGEGGGTDDQGRQNYILLRAGKRMLHRNGAHLTTVDCFEFLLSLPKDAILVGFSIGYDATQWMRGIMGDAMERILNPKQGRHGPLPVYWRDYAVVWPPGQYFSVARLYPDRNLPSGSHRRRKVIPGSTRTINEVFGFFQNSFINTIETWNIGDPKIREFIGRMKDKRTKFRKLTPKIIAYCGVECAYLGQLMEELRAVCRECDIVPQHWRGAGHLSARLLQKHDHPQRPLPSDIADKQQRRPFRPAEFEAAGNTGYVGGRGEAPWIGRIPGPVYQYDINSAYPAAMRSLPCPLHTVWKHHTPPAGPQRHPERLLPKTGVYLARLSFTHAEDEMWCGLPLRRKNTILFPREGVGWYWSPELRAALRYARTKIVQLFEWWEAHTNCDCDTYHWIDEVFEERKKHGKTTRGIPLKLALNSCYGKLAQRVGKAPFLDIAGAGLTTAITRARLLETLQGERQNIIMMATDAVYSRVKLSLDIGDGLGQWTEKLYPSGIFIVQHGVYWAHGETPTIRTRGAPRSIIGKLTPEFENVWDQWIKDYQAWDTLPFEQQFFARPPAVPHVPVSVDHFIAHRLAYARHKPKTAGRWDTIARKISFSWKNKRDTSNFTILGSAVRTMPQKLDIGTVSEPYDPASFDKYIGEQRDQFFEGEAEYTPFLPHEE